MHPIIQNITNELVRIMRARVTQSKELSKLSRDEHYAMCYNRPWERDFRKRRGHQADVVAAADHGPALRAKLLSWLSEDRYDFFDDEVILMHGIIAQVDRQVWAEANGIPYPLDDNMERRFQQI